MRKPLISVIVLVLTIVLPATAKVETHKLRPYVASFNLTTTEKLYINPEEPKIYDDFQQYGLKFEDSHGKEHGWLGNRKNI